MNQDSGGSTNPVLVEVTRGNRVESVHRGAIAVCDPNGATVTALGDISEPVFPRSAIKLIQALPFVQTGAATRYGFGAKELALSAASHMGAPSHAALAETMLRATGCTPDDLACGAHLPLGEREARELVCNGNEPGRCHNNCSGKHTGMLATAVHLGEPTNGYTEPGHPVQQRIRAALERLSGTEISQAEVGIDGCSAPNWAVPLTGLATAFARIVSGQNLSEADRQAADALVNACWARPEFMTGEGTLDTSLLRRFKGQLFVKSGAEGVYCGGIASSGIGLAVKIDDGAKRGAESAVKALVANLLPDAEDLAQPVPLKNWDGQVVGEVRAADALKTFAVQLTGGRASSNHPG